MQEEIVNLAIETLQHYTPIHVSWKNIPQSTNTNLEYDGMLEISVDGQKISLYAEVKKEIRSYQLVKLFYQAEKLRNEQKQPLIVIAERIFPKIKEELRKHNIAYLEANGNIYLRQKGIYLWVEGNKPYQRQDEESNRAFTKTGLKVVFDLMLHEDWVNKPYREIADLTEVGLGNINYIYNGLKDLGFLIRKNKDTYQLTQKKKLLEKWMVAYEEKLKPSLKIGNFRFAKENDFANWKNLEIQKDKTCWGEEAAADLLTNYLRPSELMLYTSESRVELMKKYRFIPDQEGPLKIYQKFWHYHESVIAPPLLIYADLMNTHDKRSLETAEKIYDKFLREQL